MPEVMLVKKKEVVPKIKLTLVILPAGRQLDNAPTAKMPEHLPTKALAKKQLAVAQLQTHYAAN